MGDVREYARRALAETPDYVPREAPYKLPRGSLPDGRADLDYALRGFTHTALSSDIFRGPDGALDFNFASRQGPPLVLGINGMSGIGKTAETQRILVADAVAAGRNVVIFVPRHAVGDQWSDDLAELGIRSVVYRSREAQDRDKTPMCQLNELQSAIGGALGDIQSLACHSAKGTCQHFEECRFQRQLRNVPPVRILTHACLPRKPPEFVGNPDIVVIDEAFYLSAEKDITLDPNWLVHNRAIDTKAFPLDRDGRNMDWEDLRYICEKTYAALVKLRDYGRIPKNTFADITAKEVGFAAAMEWKRKLSFPEIHPGKPPDHNIAAAIAKQEHNQKVRAVATFFKYLAVTLNDEYDHSLYLKFDPNAHMPWSETMGPGVIISIRKQIDFHWRKNVPTLHLDATMNKLAVREFYPQADIFDIDVEVPCPPAVTIHQITDYAHGKSSVIASDGASERTNSFRDKRFRGITEFIEILGWRYKPERVALITFLDLENSVKLWAGLPSNVDTAHYKDVTGINNFKDHRAFIAIGRIEPPYKEMEKLWSMISGRDPIRIPDDAKEKYYPKLQTDLIMRNGGLVPVENTRHPDQGVESLRWQNCQGELLQAGYRLRFLDRTSENWAHLYIATNLALPIPVDHAMTWAEMQPSFTEWMLYRDGAAPRNPEHAHRLHPDLFLTPKAAKRVFEKEPIRDPQNGLIVFRGFLISQDKLSRTVGAQIRKPQNSIKATGLIEYGGFLAAVSYRQEGVAGVRRPSLLLYDTRRVSDPAVWLRERLGLAFKLVRLED